MLNFDRVRRIIRSSRAVHPSWSWLFVFLMLLPGICDGAGHLLILCPQQWQRSLDRYAEVRRKQGWQVTVLAPAGPDCAAVHHQISCFFWRHRLSSGHLFLIGNSDFMPFPDSLSGRTSIFSDGAYSRMDGEGDGLADWAWGRLPAENEEQLQLYLDRVLDCSGASSAADCSPLPGPAWLDGDSHAGWEAEQSRTIQQQAMQELLSGRSLTALWFPSEFSGTIRQEFSDEMKSVLGSHRHCSWGEVLEATEEGLSGRLTALPGDWSVQGIGWFGDPTLRARQDNHFSESECRARRWIPKRISGENQFVRVAVRFFFPADFSGWLLVRENIPWGWQPENICWNGHPEKSVFDRGILKILVQAGGKASPEILEYHLRGRELPGRLYQISGTFLEDDILHRIRGSCRWMIPFRKEVLETPLEYGWNLLCCPGCPSSEELAVSGRELFWQIAPGGEQCWIRRKIGDLRMEEGFWFFNSEHHCKTRQWLVLPLPESAAGQNHRQWRLSHGGQASPGGWIWQNHRYRQISGPAAQGRGIWIGGP